MYRLHRHATRFICQVTAEIKLFWRSREAVILTFATPMLGMALFVYLNREGMLDKVYNFLIRGMGGSNDIGANQQNPLVYITLGMITYCIIAAAFEGPTPQLVRQREGGILKRLGGTPMPVWILLVAKALSAAVLIFIEVSLIFAVGLVSSDITFAGSLWSLGLLIVLGTFTMAALGFILSSLATSADAAVVMVHAVYIPMLLLCGAFVPLEAMPKAFQVIAKALPLTYFVAPFRSIMVDGANLAANAGDLLVLLAWTLGCWAVSIKLFRWQ